MSEREMDFELEQVVNTKAQRTEPSEEWSEGFHAERRNNRRTRLAAKAAYSLIGAAGFMGLHVSGLLVDWIALPVFFVFSLVCSSSLGRLMEMNRR